MESMTLPRAGLGVASSSSSLFACGGGEASEQLRSVEQYDAASGVWRLLPPMQYHRFATSALMLDGTLYVLGGLGHHAHNVGQSYLETVERYDPREGVWHSLAPLTHARLGSSAAAFGGCIHAVGGFGATGSLASVEALDPRRPDRWQPGPQLRRPRCYHCVLCSEDGLFAIGGFNQSAQEGTPWSWEVLKQPGGRWTDVKLPADANPRISFLAGTCLSALGLP